MPLRYWALIILLGAVWGCSFLFNAILIREISPLWVSAGRVTIGAVICWLFFLGTRKPLPRDWSLYPQFLLLGILNYAIPFALFPYAEMTVASSIVGVINGMTPMTTVIVSQLWPGGEKATWNKSIGVLVGLGGAIILASPSFGEGASAQIVGLLAALGATVCYALTLNYARRFKNVDSTVTASASLTGAALVDGPFRQGESSDLVVRASHRALQNYRYHESSPVGNRAVRRGASSVLPRRANDADAPPPRTRARHNRACG